MVLEYTPKIAIALSVLFIGWFIISRISKVLYEYFERTDYAPPEVESFIHSIVTIGLKVMLVITVAGMLGIETTSFVGVLAAMGFAVGLALQGNLSNFAAGVMILLMRPFRLGDEVKIQGYWAYVHEIQIFHTVLRNFDKTLVTIPNNVIMSGAIHNFSGQDIRALKIKLTLPYSEDVSKVRQLITDAAFSVPKVDTSKKPFFWIRGYKEYGIEISLNFTTTQEGFWATEVAVNEAVIAKLNEHKVKVAYPMGVVFGQFGSSPNEVAKTLTGVNGVS